MWELAFVTSDAEWDVNSLLDLRRVDPKSWHRLLQLFDKLATVPADNHPECEGSIAEVAGWYKEKCQSSCNEAIVRLSVAWKAFHSDWMRFLDKVFSQHCLTEQPVICGLGLSLLSPRNIGERKFGLPFYVALSRQLSICAHETLHFRYFEWLATHYPNIAPEEYDSPYQPWIVSEIVAAVLANDPFAVERFGPGPVECYACPRPVFATAVNWWLAERPLGDKFKSFYERVCQVVDKQHA